MDQSDAHSYQNPLGTRYAGKAMRELFSPLRRAHTWRDVWIALAEAEHELGLGITDEQLCALRESKDQIDLGRVAELEAELRHDVMAHVHHWGEVAPLARPILHLGATSCFVTDNADLILFREALGLIEGRILLALQLLRKLAERTADLPCLGYTHFQAAQPVTFGKRVSLWMQDLVFDLDELRTLRATMPLRGAKGTTGTQASYLELFDGDHSKVRALDQRIAEKLGFEKTLAVSGQTYPRKYDHELLARLSGIAQSAAKFAVDMRLLSHEGEVSEPFTDKQIGSSAMAYKRNPMRCERIGSLARLVASLAGSAAATAMTQWLERTLDDSAIRRITLPESFLAIDAILILVASVSDGMHVYPQMMRRHLDEQLPFMATETILMEGVRAGGDRQDLHEKLRVHAVEAARLMKEEGRSNPLLGFLEQDLSFAFVHGRLQELLDPAELVGRAPEQVAEFLAEVVAPRLEGFAAGFVDELRV